MIPRSHGIPACLYALDALEIARFAIITEEVSIYKPFLVDLLSKKFLNILLAVVLLQVLGVDEIKLRWSPPLDAATAGKGTGADSNLQKRMQGHAGGQTEDYVTMCTFAILSACMRLLYANPA